MKGFAAFALRTNPLPTSRLKKAVSEKNPATDLVEGDRIYWRWTDDFIRDNPGWGYNGNGHYGTFSHYDGQLIYAYFDMDGGRRQMINRSHLRRNPDPVSGYSVHMAEEGR